ncbi:MAG: hypothetical protein JRE38_01840 [Deltaproteobacteria bacterium]|nr:hypothetical protein [Deltaproteobacteria bacterium]MBW2576790.1 hypothetical protein [Deltaproteobacteria bacterium]MBW2694770.1 hypothetical protein [Deltaproteobacteria bacterium]
MFGKRPDATLVRDLSAMRRFMPYVSPRRNDSVFYMNQEIRADAAFEFMEKANKERPRNRPITLFHLYLRAVSIAMLRRPGVNRFVKAGRLWQRDGVWITFSAKKKLIDGAPMITIKRCFHPESETLGEMTDATYEQLSLGRKGKKTTSEKEMDWLLRLPHPLPRIPLAIARFADHFGLLPRKIIDADPLYSSVFIANLGSINYPAGFHHLWEYGTTSIFAVMGEVEQDATGGRKFTAAYTYDERIEDGLYSQYSLGMVRDWIANPETMVEPAKPPEDD